MPPLYPAPHPNPCAMSLAFPRGFCSSGKMTSLDIFDMYFVKLHIYNQYLVNICLGMERVNEK